MMQRIFHLRRVARVAVAATVFGMLTACAVAPQSADDAVMARAQARWDALVAKDYKKAYGYMAPSYRALVNEADFQRRFGISGSWSDVAVHSAKCEAERCQVKVRVAASLMVPLPGVRAGQEQKVSSYYDEPWVREDGQWWFYQAP